MMACLITFRSVMPGQRGEAVLRRAGIDCRLQRTPRFMQEQGCGYSLTLRQRDAMKSVQLLREHQIPFQKLYLRRESGSYEEMIL